MATHSPRQELFGLGKTRYSSLDSLTNMLQLYPVFLNAVGVRMSMFYAYFFLRIAMENPDAVVNMKSFTSDRDVLKVATFTRHGGIQRVESRFVRSI